MMQNENNGRRSILARRALWIGAAAACPALLAAWMLGFGDGNFLVPVSYQGDGVAIAMMVKGTIENGWYLTNPSLGAPGVLQMHTQPGGDNLCWALLKILTLVTSEPFLVADLLFLLTFALCSVASFVVLRRLGIPPLIAFAGSLAYSLLPYHFYRGVDHLFYSAYFLVPVGTWLALTVASGDLFPAQQENGTARRWIGLAVIIVLIGSNGVYYPFFTCFLTLIASVVVLLEKRSLRPFFTGLAIIVAIGSVFFLNQLPSLIYLRNSETPLVSRAPAESEIYALKIVQLLLPTSGHRVEAFAKIAREYQSQFPLVNENVSASLGLLISGGFLILLTTVIFPAAARRWQVLATPVMRHLATLNLSALLLGTVGGFSALLALMVFAKIRCYNRLSVFIAFFAVVALTTALSALVRRVTQSYPSRAARGFTTAALLTLFVFGIWDETRSDPQGDRQGRRIGFEADRLFSQRIQALMSPGAMIFQLPYMEFPEAGGVHRMPDYTPFIPYLHTHGLRWSYGALRNSSADLWQKNAATAPVPVFLQRISVAGFSGVYLDRRGFVDRAAAIEDGLRKATGTEPLVDPRGNLLFFDIGNFAKTIRADLSTEAWEERQRDLLYSWKFDWGGGCSGLEGTTDQNWRWCPNQGELRVRNDAPYARRLTVRAMLFSAQPSPARLSVRSDFWNTDLTISSEGTALEQSVDFPPGEHVVNFSCDGKPAAGSGDPRVLVWRVDNFRVE